MARCGFCDEEMIVVEDCAWTRANQTVTFLDNAVLPIPPYAGPAHRCEYCFVAQGNFHHPDCPGARCPRCGREQRSCDCWDQRFEIKAVQTAKEMFHAFGVPPRESKRRSRRGQ